MKTQEGFFDKLLKRLDKIDQQSLEQYVLSIQHEKQVVYDVLHALPDGIVIVDQKGIVTFCNEAAKKILMRSASEVRPLLYDVLLDEELRTFIMYQYQHRLRVVNYCIEVMRPHTMRLCISTLPIYDDRGESCVSFAIVLHDRASEDSVTTQYRNDNIEGLIKLASGVAHEIGNPLNTITIYLKLISQKLKRTKDRQIRTWVSIVTEETKRLDKIVKNFLTIARNQVGIYKRADINKVIQQALKFLQPEIKKQDIDTKLTLQDEIPKFFFDPEKMYEVFLNIIKNAIEALPYGGAIEIKSMKKGNVISVYCIDNGIGINEEDLPHIFDAYYTSKKKGSGLGLMNVYNIVKAHKGRIHVQSKTGEGTVVSVNLPFQREKLQLPFIKAVTKKGKVVKES